MLKTIKLFSKTKFFFQKPKKNEILIFDQTHLEFFKNALNLDKEKVSHLSTRFEDFNLNVFF